MKETIAKSKWWDNFNMALYLHILLIRQQRSEDL